MTRPIDAAKELVPTIDLADRLCGPGQMRKVGEKWTARCPLPDHEDRSPSFVVYPASGGWWCFGCNRGGDVVNLAMVAWQIEHPEVAAAEVLMVFGYEPPPRPASWYRKQERQRDMRDVIEEARIEVHMRRLWRYVVEPILAQLERPDEREEMADKLWPILRGRVHHLRAERGGRE